MKSTLIVMVLLGCFATSSQAQIIIMTGEVTSASGIFSSSISSGAGVSLKLDFTNHPVDLFQGAISGLALYSVPADFTVDGAAPLPAVSPLRVYLTDSYWPQFGGAGLFVEQVLFGANHGQFIQALLASGSVGSSTLFPANIPFSRFTDVRGSFISSAPEAPGELHWLMNGYSGFAEGQITPPPPFSAVPEPSLYGMSGVIGLVGLVLIRRKATGRGSLLQRKLKA